MNSVLEIVKNYLTTNGYDGLYNPNGDCACIVADLKLGDCMYSECQPGYRIECDCGEQCEYHIIGEKK